jgi:hypothetical protein
VADSSTGARVDITELRRLHTASTRSATNYAEALQTDQAAQELRVLFKQELPSLLDELAASRQATHEVTEAARALLAAIEDEWPGLSKRSNWLGSRVGVLRAALGANDG